MSLSLLKSKIQILNQSYQELFDRISKCII